MRRLEAIPNNVLAFFQALDSAWFDLEEAEFVGRIVDETVSINAIFVEHLGEACRRH
jgi:hypothetical protein